MLSTINIAPHEPSDRTPDVDADDVAAFKAYAGGMRYAQRCEEFVRLRKVTPERPRDLSNSPVLHAWMEVLAIEASLLEYARARGLGETTAYRLFVALRGDGIPRKPAWELAVRRAMERRSDP